MPGKEAAKAAAGVERVIAGQATQADVDFFDGRFKRLLAEATRLEGVPAGNGQAMVDYQILRLAAVRQAYPDVTQGLRELSQRRDEFEPYVEYLSGEALDYWFWFDHDFGGSLFLALPSAVMLEDETIDWTEEEIGSLTSQVRGNLNILDIALGQAVLDVAERNFAHPYKLQTENLFDLLVETFQELCWGTEAVVSFDWGDVGVESEVNRLGIRQVLLNIFKNMKKYGRGEAGSLMIEVALRRFEDLAGVAVFIADQGRGFAKEMVEIGEAGVERVFESGQTTGGTGYGGAIVKRICDKNGVSIQAFNGQDLRGVPGFEDKDWGAVYVLWFPPAGSQPNAGSLE